MANNALLLEIMDLIEHPEKMPEGTEWDQSDWFKHKEIYVSSATSEEVAHACGTSFCFAGWAVYLDGFTEFVPPKVDKDGLRFSEGSLRNPDTDETLDAVQVQFRASRLLVLSDGDADILFEASNTKENLRAYVDALVSGESLDEYEDDYEEAMP